MTNIVKNAVLEHLEQQSLMAIYNDADFKQYYRKFNKGFSNKYHLALNIVSAFILNSPPVLPND